LIYIFIIPFDFTIGLIPKAKIGWHTAVALQGENLTLITHNFSWLPRSTGLMAFRGQRIKIKQPETKLASSIEKQASMFLQGLIVHLFLIQMNHRIKCFHDRERQKERCISCVF
jgi:hypothetical protein